jgi:intracellular septation protein A
MQDIKQSFSWALRFAFVIASTEWNIYILNDINNSIWIHYKRITTDYVYCPTILIRIFTSLMMQPREHGQITSQDVH